MSFIEAKEDGVRVSGGKMGTNYHPKCHKCNQETWSLNYRRGHKYTCAECKEKEREVKATCNKEKADRQFTQAVRILKKQIRRNKKDLFNYAEAIESVNIKSQKNNLFDSKEEMLVAMVLEEAEIAYRQQEKISDHKVDFILPYENIVIEVDGKLYHNSSNAQKDRDIDNNVQTSLGDDWLIIRLSDDAINDNALYLCDLFYELKNSPQNRESDNRYDDIYDAICFYRRYGHLIQKDA